MTFRLWRCLQTSMIHCLNNAECNCFQKGDSTFFRVFLCFCAFLLLLFPVQVKVWAPLVVCSGPLDQLMLLCYLVIVCKQNCACLWWWATAGAFGQLCRCLAKQTRRHSHIWNSFKILERLIRYKQLDLMSLKSKFCNFWHIGKNLPFLFQHHMGVFWYF